MLDTLGWRENKTRADTYWKNIKRSIRGVRVTRLESSITTYMNIKETITCHRDNNDNQCDTRYYYKQVAIII